MIMYMFLFFLPPSSVAVQFRFVRYYFKNVLFLVFFVCIFVWHPFIHSEFVERILLVVVALVLGKLFVVLLSKKRKEKKQFVNDSYYFADDGKQGKSTDIQNLEKKRILLNFLDDGKKTRNENAYTQNLNKKRY